MAEEDVSEYIRSQEQAKEETTLITGDDIITPPCCACCGLEMRDTEYNESTPETDYIVHVLPGADDATPSDKDYYCSVVCFAEEVGLQFE